MTKPIYLDYNATTPHDPEVIAAMRPFLETEFGNPSSTHPYGIIAKKAVETARGQVAALLDCRSREVIFTSGGTESINHAISGTARALCGKGNHIITSQVEHPAVLETCRRLERDGFKTTCLPVDGYGIVYADDVEAAIRPGTVLITIMHANNEVGSIQPIREIAAIARARGIAFHVDAAQSVGKIPVKVNDLGVDLLSVAGHKLYAPKGIGALFIRQGIDLEKLVHGAGQEMGKRAGTENVMEIVGLGKACEIIHRSFAAGAEHMREMRELLFAELKKELPPIRVNGHPDLRLPNTLSVSFKNLEANRILEEIGLQVAVSAGAACHSGKVEVSHVLQAMNVPAEWARGTIRFSTGRMTTPAEIRRAVGIIVNGIRRLTK
ncbi:MAG: cysteine desulfurase family protein [Thermodesulfobacteriota bacterium]